METKKPKPTSGFHGNQYVDSQGRPRNTSAGGGHKPGLKKTGKKNK